jgi:biopolymer transport protein ExbD
MAKATAYDVWLVASDQIYKGVPYQVLAGWIDTGRAAPTDRVRPAGSNEAWLPVKSHPVLSDFVRKAAPVAAPVAAVADAAATLVHHEELEAPELEFFKHPEEEDTEVDMIPLIDISLVLLIFFMMTSVVSALSPVDVPAIASGHEPSNEADALSVQIDLRPNGSAFYAIQQGTGAIAPENNNLESLPEVKARLDAILGTVTKPPEARITCNKKIKHVRVAELVTVLDEYRRRGLIIVYKAEVNEQPK